MQTLLLASSSVSRQQLLKDAGIPLSVIAQNADELSCDWGLPLEPLVTAIALHKMAHVNIPEELSRAQGSAIFVLTADTLSQDAQGVISGKPAHKDAARELLRAARTSMCTGTAFCLDKKVWRDQCWHVQERIVRYVQASYSFKVPEHWIEAYLTHSHGLATAGAIAIEGYGSLFLESVQGSYTTIVGLPVYELRESLETIGFFDKII